MADFPDKTLAEWRELAARELGGKDPGALDWHTLEGIEVKPLYTAADLEALEARDTLPGFPPFLRGVRATMYANRPWTVRQYAGFSTAEDFEPLLPRQPRGGPDRALRGVRSRHSPRL